MRAIPFEISDAVELWARQQGRHGSIRRYQNGIAVIELSLKSDDPRMKGWQEGRLKKEPREVTPLAYQPTYRDEHGRIQKAERFVPIDLEELGVSGVLEILNRGNLASGTGEFKDVMQAVQSVAEKNDRLRDSILAAARDGARARARDYVRTITPKSFVPSNIQA